MQNWRIGHAGLRVVLAPARHVNDDFIFAVAVEIADGTVIDGVAGRRFHGDFDVLPDGRVGGKLVEERLAHFLLDAANNGPHEVGVGLGRIDAGIDIVRGIGDWRGVQLHRGAVVGGAIEIERDIVRVGAEHAPTDEDFSVACVQCDDAAAEVFHLAGRRFGRRRL